MEEKNVNLAKTISKLITDGNQEVLGKIQEVQTKLGNRINDLEGQINSVEKNLRGEIQKVEIRLDKKIDAFYDMLHYDIGEVEKKVDKFDKELKSRLRQPA